MISNSANSTVVEGVSSDGFTTQVQPAANEADRLARLRHARLGETRIDAVMKKGLHQYLEEFLAENAELNAAISRQFRFI